MDDAFVAILEISREILFGGKIDRGRGGFYGLDVCCIYSRGSQHDYACQYYSNAPVIYDDIEYQRSKNLNDSDHQIIAVQSHCSLILI